MEEFGSRLVVKAKDNTNGKPQSFQQGDIIHCMTVAEGFGTEELQRDMFLCIHCSDMPYSEAVSITSDLLPSKDGRYISRPSKYYLDLGLLPKKVKHPYIGAATLTRAEIRKALKSREPFTNHKKFVKEYF
jgi:predicted TIM-barrel enzyme